MKSEYQKSLEAWAHGLSNEKLGELLTSKKITGVEFDALLAEDLRRIG